MGRRRNLVLALVAIAGLGLTAPAASSAGGKKEPVNPLAGRWVGMTESTTTYPGTPAPVSYRITNSGQVVDFTTTVTLHYWLNPPPPPTTASP